MAGEDKILKVLLQVQSDTSDLGKLRSGVEDLKKSLADAAAPGASVAEQLRLAGAEFDPVSRSFRSMNTDTKELAENWLLTGASLNKAKAEALVLGRELVTGSFNARTLGAFLGSLGPSLTIGAIAGFALVEVLQHA